MGWWSESLILTTEGWPSGVMTTIGGYWGPAMFTLEECPSSMTLTIWGYPGSVMITIGIPVVLITSAAHEWIQ